MNDETLVEIACQVEGCCNYRLFDEVYCGRHGARLISETKPLPADLADRKRLLDAFQKAARALDQL